MANTGLQAKLRALPVLEGASHPRAEFASFPSTPYQAFEKWLDEAISANVPEPHAMTISTVDSQGHPDARVLILKNIDHRGWHFAIKATSPKGLQISTNNNVALTFYWPKIGRQIRLRGKANALPRSECEQDWTARSAMAKITAKVSRQSEPLNDPHELEAKMAAAVKSHEIEGGELDSEGWVVYAVAPQTVEFWQASSDRLHQRLQYTLDPAQNTWSKSALWP